MWCQRRSHGWPPKHILDIVHSKDFTNEITLTLEIKCSEAAASPRGVLVARSSGRHRRGRVRRSDRRPYDSVCSAGPRHPTAIGPIGSADQPQGVAVMDTTRLRDPEPGLLALPVAMRPVHPRMWLLVGR